MPFAVKSQTLRTFNEGLEDLQRHLLLMAHLTELNLNRAVEAFLHQREEAAKICIADDDEVDQLEIEIDRISVDILVRFSPVAADLRQVIASMKIAHNLERVSDVSVNISRKVLRLLQYDCNADDIELIRPIIEDSVAMFKESVRCYCDTDLEAASNVRLEEGGVDDLAHEIGKRLVREMSQNPAQVPPLLELIFINRHFERIADLATHIAEDVIFKATNRDIRHTAE